MTSFRPAADSSPGDWLFTSRDDWMDLARFGPPGFESYLRVRIVGVAQEPFETVLKVLASATAEPDVCFAGVWEGWTSAGSMPVAPAVEIPNRRMLLFAASASELLAVPGRAWSTAGEIEMAGRLVEAADRTVVEVCAPHLMWPADQSWCVACDVHEELEFTVGCSAAQAGRVLEALGDAVREVAYGADLPLD